MAESLIRVGAHTITATDGRNSFPGRWSGLALPVPSRIALAAVSFLLARASGARAVGGPALRVGLPSNMGVLSVPGVATSVGLGNRRATSYARNGCGS